MDDSYSLALMVQDACNLSGVGHDFSKLATMVRDEYTREHDGAIMPTAEFAAHPAVFLYVAKMCDLLHITLESKDLDRYIDAYEACKAKAKTNWHVGTRG